VAEAAAETAPANTAPVAERPLPLELPLSLDLSDVTAAARSGKGASADKPSTARILLAQLKAEMDKLSTDGVGAGFPANAPSVEGAVRGQARTERRADERAEGEQQGRREPSNQGQTEREEARDTATHPTGLANASTTDAAVQEARQAEDGAGTTTALAEFEAARAADERARRLTLLLLKFTQAEAHSRWVEVIDVGEQALKVEPQQPAVRSATARAYKFRGTMYHHQRNFVLAIADQTRAIELEPKQADYYYKRGLSYQGKGDFERALADFYRATELAPNYAEYYFARGTLYMAHAELGRATEDFTRAIALNGNEPRYYAQRGLLACRQHSARLFNFGQDDLERAIADFSRAIQLDAKDASNHAFRGGVYQLKGDRDCALADISRAIELAPQVANYYYARGTLHDERGDPAAAQRNFKRAAELGDANARRELERAPQPARPGQQKARRASKPPTSGRSALALLAQRIGTVLAASLGLIFGIVVVYICLLPWFFSHPGDGTDVLRWLGLVLGLFICGHSAWMLWLGLDTRRRSM
jgi:tetratricopeptide (TPR) repeat protein